MSEKRRNTTRNPYRTVSASERRARDRARQGARPNEPAAARTPSSSKAAVLRQEVVNDLLLHPTKSVTEDDLRRSYSYVLADLRSMALLAAGLVVLLVVLALVLPR